MYSIKYKDVKYSSSLTDSGLFCFLFINFKINNMRKLDESKVYSLEDLTSEERKKLLEPLNLIGIKKANYLSFGEPFGWVLGTFHNKETVNAKELFYTLENVQVDCRELSEEQIKELADVFKANGYKIWDNYNALDVTDVNYLLEFSFNEVFVTFGSEDKTTITYSKFMELFAEPQYEVTMIAEQPKETFNPQPHYNNDKGSLYKVAQDRNWNAYLFDIVKRLERGGKKDPLEQEIQKSIDVLKLWLIEATQ